MGKETEVSVMEIDDPKSNNSDHIIPKFSTNDPVSNVMRAYSQVLPFEAQKLNLILTSTPSYIPRASHMVEGARLLLPQRGQSDVVIAVYDNDPISIISYTLSSKEYEDCVSDKSVESQNSNECITDSASTQFSVWQSFGSMDLDHIHYGLEDISSSRGSLFADNKKSPHMTISFGDDCSTAGGKLHSVPKELRGEREILVQNLLVKGDDLEILVELLKLVAAGEDLGDLAAEYSMCPSKDEGGVLGWVKKGQMLFFSILLDSRS